LVTINPTTGAVNTIGAIGANFPFGTQLDYAYGFDIDASNGIAYAALDTISKDGIQFGLYTINLGTGAATLVSPFNAQFISASEVPRGLAIAPAVTYQFSAANYTVAENAGAVTVTVTRTGTAEDLMSTGSVRYATKDFDVCAAVVPTPCASARSDYTPTYGKLEFAAGETTKTFSVLITDDALPEAAESFNVVLSAPVNGFLGAQSTAVITITDMIRIRRLESNRQRERARRRRFLRASAVQRFFEPRPGRCRTRLLAHPVDDEIQRLRGRGELSKMSFECAGARLRSLLPLG
jgi:hypothetical protein